MSEQPQPLWTVTGTRQTSMLLSNGSYGAAMEVTFKTQDGHIATVTVPMTDFNRDTVKQKIDDYVDAYASVRFLQSDITA